MCKGEIISFKNCSYSNTNTSNTQYIFDISKNLGLYCMYTSIKTLQPDQTVQLLIQPQKVKQRQMHKCLTFSLINTVKQLQLQSWNMPWKMAAQYLPWHLARNRMQNSVKCGGLAFLCSVLPVKVRSGSSERLTLLIRPLKRTSSAFSCCTLSASSSWHTSLSCRSCGQGGDGHYRGATDVTTNVHTVQYMYISSYTPKAHMKFLKEE